MIQLTDSLDQQLFDCSDDLKTIIENMNSMSDPNSTSLCKVTAVLSNHIDTLNWVGGQTAALDGKLGELRVRIYRFFFILLSHLVFKHKISITQQIC